MKVKLARKSEKGGREGEKGMNERDRTRQDRLGFPWMNFDRVDLSIYLSIHNYCAENIPTSNLFGDDQEHIYFICLGEKKKRITIPTLGT